MKFYINISGFLLIFCMLISSCGNKNTNASTRNSPGFTPADQNASQPLDPSSAFSNNSGVDHYTCPNGHPGAQTAGTCASCGATLEHNDAYHQTPEGVPNASDLSPNSGVANAGGQFHYICPEGCEGGLDNDGVCPKCGAQMVHNTAYHSANGSSPDLAAGGANPLQISGQGGTSGVFHYTCPNGHAGGSSSEGSCQECGAALVHNPAFHNQPTATGAPTIGGPPVAGSAPVQQTPTTLPAQNASGVYHYVCSKSCGGGGSSGGVCPKCGAPLEHNAAYHQ